jgi:hypothetical protein
MFLRVYVYLCTCLYVLSAHMLYVFMYTCIDAEAGKAAIKGQAKVSVSSVLVYVCECIYIYVCLCLCMFACFQV